MRITWASGLVSIEFTWVPGLVSMRATWGPGLAGPVIKVGSPRT